MGSFWCGCTDCSPSYIRLCSDPSPATRSCELPGPWSSIGLHDRRLESCGGHLHDRVWVGHWEEHIPFLYRVPGHPSLAILHDVNPCLHAAPLGLEQLNPPYLRSL